MENVSKALLIAGTFLVAIILLSLIVTTFSKLKVTPNEQNLQYDHAEITTYNKGFEVYQKPLMYGTDAISVINKALDYNLRNAVPGHNYFSKSFSDPVNGALMDVKVKLKNENLDFSNRITIFHYNAEARREFNYPTDQGPFGDKKTIKEVLNFEGGRYKEVLGEEVLKLPFVSATEPYDFSKDKFIYKDKGGDFSISTGSLRGGVISDPEVNFSLMQFLSKSKIVIENPRKEEAHLWTRIIIQPPSEDLKKKIFKCEVDKTEYYRNGRIKKLTLTEVIKPKKEN